MPGWSEFVYTLSLVYGPKSTAALKQLWTFYQGLCRTHGQRTAVKVLKDVHSSAKLCLLGKKAKPVMEFGGIWFKTNSSGIPKQLSLLRPISAGWETSASDLSGAVNLIRLKPDSDISTITSGYTGTLDSKDPSWSNAVKNLGGGALKPTVGVEVNLPLSTKSGPNSPSALIGAFSDAVALRDRVDVWFGFAQVCLLTGQDHLVKRIESLTGNSKFNPVNRPLTDKPWLAKLAFLADKAGKTRIVYVANYWVQVLMKPLHDVLMKWLSSQPQDGTYDQSRTIDIVKKWTAEGKALWSYDLKAATDRWPSWHQEVVLRHLVGDKWADAWSWSVSIPAINPVSGEAVSYSVGQPMGLYSSWAAFAVTHHFTLRHLCEVAGISYDHYVILGDDLVIANRRLAGLYSDYTQSLGVVISHAKSVTADELGSISAAEFAKQLLREGKDLTPMPAPLIKELYNPYPSGSGLVQFLEWWSAHRLPAVTYSKEALQVSPQAAKVMNGLPESTQDLACLILAFRHRVSGAPFGANQTCGTGASCYYVNPLRGYNDSWILQVYLQEVSKKLEEAAENLLKVSKSLANYGGALTIAPGQGLDLPAHPWHCVLQDCRDNLKKLYTGMANGELPGGVGRFLLDVQYFTEVMTGRTSYRDYRNRKVSVAIVEGALVRNVRSSLQSMHDISLILGADVFTVRRGPVE